MARVPPPYSETLTTPSYAYDARTPVLSPSSSRSSPETQPPDYPTPPQLDPVSRLPPAFRIGTHDVRPVVDVQGLIDHCTFLACLWHLRKDVVETPWKSNTAAASDGDVDPNTKWSVFCTLAASRFEIWVTDTLTARLNGVTFPPAQDMTGRLPLKKEELPGIEVLMVWHAYMLNPRWYYEDCARQFRQLAVLGEFPMAQISAHIDPVTFQYTPPSKQPVPPYPIIPGETNHPIVCPGCNTVNSVLVLGQPVAPTPRLGFAQKGWSQQCRRCDLYITHEALQASKFYSDMVRVLRGDMEFLPGMGVHPVTGAINSARDALPAAASREIARVFLDNGAGYLASKGIELDHGLRALWHDERKTLVPEDAMRYRLLQLTTHEATREISEAMMWNVGEGELLLRALGGRTLVRGMPVKARLSVRSEMLGRRMNRMYSAYNSSCIASLALGPAVQRQANFISKCKELGWLEPGRWDSKAGQSVFILQRSAARYHAFLDLMSATPGGFLVPTLDIDLSWHTHQLQGAKYRSDTTTYIGRLVDHDDKVSDAKLGDAYDLTSRAWAARFGVPYSACGCHQHGVFAGADGPSIPSKLKFWAKDKESKADKRVRLIETAIQRMEQGEKDASHPSVHNLVAVLNLKETDQQRAERAYKQKIRDGKAEKLAVKAEVDAKARAEVALSRKKDHPDPFMYSPDMVGMGMYGGMGGSAYNNGRYRGGGINPYWGVAGAGGVIGIGVIGWGLYEEDPHCMDGQNMQRGACAAGVGGGGGGYCGTGGGAACSGSSACAAGAGACSAAAGGGCGGGGGSGGCGGGGGGGCGGGGGGGCGGGGS